MLKPYQVDEVLRLHREGYSRRAIVRRTGRARATVDRIVTGQRPDYEATRDRRREHDELFSGPPMRCPGCGGMAHLPCMVCRDRTALETRRLVARRRANPARH